MTEKEKNFILNFFRKVLMIELDFDESELEKICYEENLKAISAKKSGNDPDKIQMLQKRIELQKSIQLTSEKFLKKYPSIDAEKKSIEISRFLSSLTTFIRIKNNIDEKNPLIIKLLQEELPDFIFHWSRLNFIGQLEENIGESIFKYDALDSYSFDYREKLSSFLAEQLAEMIKDKELYEIEFIITQLLKIISARKNNIMRFDEKARQEILSILKKDLPGIIKSLEKNMGDWGDELLTLQLNETAITKFIRKLSSNSNRTAEKYKLTSIDAFESVYFKYLEKSASLNSFNLYDVVYRLAYMESILKDDQEEKVYCSALYGKALSQYAKSLKIKETEAITNIENEVMKNKRLLEQEQIKLNDSIQEMKNYGKCFEVNAMPEEYEIDRKKNKKGMQSENIPLREKLNSQHNLKAASVTTLANRLAIKSDCYYANHHYKESEKEMFCNEVMQTINNTVNAQKKAGNKSPDILSVLQGWMENIKSFFSTTIRNISRSEIKKPDPVEKVKEAIGKLTV